MRNRASIIGVILLCADVVSAQYQATWRIRHYDLEYEILPGERVYRGTAALSLENVSGRGQRSVPPRAESRIGIVDAEAAPTPAWRGSVSLV
jgi:hypothetical protein